MTEFNKPTEKTSLLKDNTITHEITNLNIGLKNPVSNFYLMASLFSATHGTTVACLSLATARLGSVGAWQSGVLSLSYMMSAILGSTYFLSRFGSRNSMILGMLIYCTYVGCFWVATAFPEIEKASALTGAAIGGLGAGLLWTAQGSYLAQAAKHYAKESRRGLSECTSSLAGDFAFIYLLLEVCLRSMSTALATFMTWPAIFGVYTIVALTATFGMIFVHNYESEENEKSLTTTAFYKATAAIRLLFTDPKMKYMIGLNFIFGFTASFLNSYVDGEVLKVALNDQNSVYVGALSSSVALSAAMMSLVLRDIRNKGAVLIGGATCFFFVAFPFILFPDATKWSVSGISTIFILHGIGRSTFESTLKATFVDFFPTESAGAFGNIILLYGLSSAVGYVLSFHLKCEEVSAYCIEYSDRSLHDVLSFELLVCFTSIAAIAGYLKAASIHRLEQDEKTKLLLMSLDV